jgi:hypothetical protein
MASMRRPVVLLLATLCGAVLVPPGLARTSGRIDRLPLNGTVALAGSHVVCMYRFSAKTSYTVECGVTGPHSGDAAVGSYIALMTAKGRVTVLVAYSNKFVFNEVAGVLMRTGTITVHPGDTIELAGTAAMICSAANSGGKPTIFCDQIDAHGNIRPNSLAFGINDAGLTALGWDPKRHVSVLKSWVEPG